MSNSFIEENRSYEFIVTGDGSPSICYHDDNMGAEAMHHRQGALAESVFIYIEAFAHALESGCLPHIFSLGLGCGYNELLSIAYILKHKPHLIPNLYIESFEADATIRNSFLDWLNSNDHNGKTIHASLTEFIKPGADTSPDTKTTAPVSLKNQLFTIFEKVLRLCAQQYELDIENLRAAAQRLYKNKQWLIQPALNQNTHLHKKFGIIYFDAFSNQSSPELWSESFLISLIDKAAAGKCTFATYAATGTLNRALRNTGFQLLAQKGFAGKRESTRAVRIMTT